MRITKIHKGLTKLLVLVMLISIIPISKVTMAATNEGEYIYRPVESILVDSIKGNALRDIPEIITSNTGGLFGLLKFDIKNLQGNITQAKIVLMCTYPRTGNPVIDQTLLAVDNNWDKNTVKATNLPAILGEVAKISANLDMSISQEVQIDVTNTIKGNGVYSFQIKGNNNAQIRYGSIFHTTPGLRPVLVIKTDIPYQNNGMSEGTPTPSLPLIRITKIDFRLDQNIALVNSNSVILEKPTTFLNKVFVVPAKFIAENMGAMLNWSEDTQTISITKDDIRIELQIGNNIAKVNGNNVNLDQCATLSDGVIIVPAKFIAEALGGIVVWNENQKKFTITFEEILNSDQLKIPSFFADNMVIQRDLPIPIWGLAPTGSEITVTLGNDTKKTISQDGRWRVDLGAKAYGGPYTLLVSDGKTNIECTNILMGDVFFCSGQSNMVVPLRNITGGVELASTANHPNIRYFTTDMTDSDTPAFEPLSALKWQTITPTNASNLAAVAYLFARFVSEGLNNEIPIGIYHSAIGSTSITSWLPAEVNKELDAAQTTDQRRPSAFYNAMVAPFFPTALKGVVWYQGESSINAVELYSKQMTAMMNNFRSKTNISNLPIIYPQLPRYDYTAQPGKWAEMREMQQDARDSNENFYMGVNIDLGEKTVIHPGDKMPLAQRLANLALKHLYNKPVIADAPFIKSNTIENNKIVIDFTNSEDGIMIKNAEKNGIEIAGEDKLFVPANAKIENNKLIVWADSISSPKYVRYAFSNYPDYSLFSNNGLPVAPFRTDLVLTPKPITTPPTSNKIEIQIDKNIAKVNGNNVTLDQSATLLNGRTVVPARFIAENMGASVEWEENTQTVSIVKGDIKIEIQIDKNIAKVNGNNVTLDQSATLLNGRTVVPARFIAEALGGKVEWNEETEIVTISVK